MNINGKNSILQKLIFEVRYEYGYAYLDKCGRIVNAITREFPEWAIRAIDVNGASLVNLRDDCSLSFSSKKFDFSLEQDPGSASLSLENLADFAEQAELLSAILIEQLGLKDFTRMGFRSFHWFSCGNINDAIAWIDSLGFYSVLNKLEDAFGGKREATSFTVIIPGENWKYRIELIAVERHLQFNFDHEMLKTPPHLLHRNQRQHLLNQMATRKKLEANPPFAAVIDVDVFQEFPLVVTPDNFIKSSYQELTNRLKAAVSTNTKE